MFRSQNIFFVTYPRSGHHSLIKLLSASGDFSNNYCEYYDCLDGHAKTVDMCPSKTVPWAERKHICGTGRRYLKNHDFNGELPFSKSSRYIVQIRHPFYAIESWHQLHVDNGLPIEKVSFFNQKLEYFERFVKRWISENGKKPNVLVCRYDEQGVPAMQQQIYDFLQLPRPDKKVAMNHFTPTRTSLRLFEPHYYKCIEERIAPLLDEAKLDKIFE